MSITLDVSVFEPLAEAITALKQVKFTPTMGMKWLATVLIGLGMFIAMIVITSDAQSLGSRYWVRYTSYLDRSLRSMFIFIPGRTIAIYQLLAMAGFAALALIRGDGNLYLGMIAAAYGPKVYIDNKQKKRLETAEEQLPAFLQILANALRASPNIATALGTIRGSLEPPMKDEVGLALKELRVGAPLDQALLHMAARLKSRAIDSAISTLLIGRQVGGDLPKILDTTAASLREIFRLEGVVKTKTADAKNQLLMMTFMPGVIVVLFNWLQPGYFDPLFSNATGYICAGAAVAGWIAALLWARSILAVEV